MSTQRPTTPNGNHSGGKQVFLFLFSNWSIMCMFLSMYVLKSVYFSLQILPALCVLIHHTDVNVSKYFMCFSMCVYVCMWDGEKMLHWTSCQCILSHFFIQELKYIICHFCTLFTYITKFNFSKKIKPNCYFGLSNKVYTHVY